MEIDINAAELDDPVETEFQRQVTPADRCHARGRSTNQASELSMDDESTEDEDEDLDKPSARSQSSTTGDSAAKSQITTSPKRSSITPGIGRIGGRKAQTYTERSHDPIDQETSEHQYNGDTGLNSRDSSRQATKIGMIGGKKIAAAHATRPQNEHIAHHAGVKLEPQSLDHQKDPADQSLRGDKSTETSAQKQPSDEECSSDVRAQRETSEERATRRREELKRQLDVAKAPAKKKRKF